MHAAAAQRARGHNSSADSPSARLSASLNSSVLDLSAFTARMGVNEAEAARLRAASPTDADGIADEASIRADGGEDAATTPAETAAGVDLPPLLPELWGAIARCDAAKHPACSGIPVRRPCPRA